MTTKINSMSVVFRVGDDIILALYQNEGPPFQLEVWVNDIIIVHHDFQIPMEAFSSKDGLRRYALETYECRKRHE